MSVSTSATVVMHRPNDCDVTYSYLSVLQVNVNSSDFVYLRKSILVRAMNTHR